MSFDKFEKRVVYGGGHYNFEIGSIPFWAAIPSGRAVNLTIPGTPPYMVRSTLFDTETRVQEDFWHLPGNLTTNQSTWTPQLEAGARDLPQADGDGTDYRPKFEAGDSVVWVFTEMKGNFTSQDVFNDAYATGNFTIVTEEAYKKLDSVYSEGRPNGSVVKRPSLKGLVLAAVLCVSVLAR